MRISSGLRGLRALRAVRANRSHGATRATRALWAMLFLGVWSLNPSLYYLKCLAGHQDGMSAVAAHSIRAPQQKKEICHHHPHGCPKDCFCPKFHADEGAAPDGSGGPSVNRESLRQPVLVQCTEDKAAAGPPAGVVALAVSIGDIRIPCLATGRCPLRPVPSLLETTREPPPKVPIA